MVSQFIYFYIKYFTSFMVVKIFKKIILENVGGIFRVFLKYEKNDSGTMGDFKNKIIF